MIYAVLNKKTLRCEDFALCLTIYFLLELLYLPLDPISLYFVGPCSAGLVCEPCGFPLATTC